VKVTVIAAGFDRWDAGAGQGKANLKAVENKPPATLKDLFNDDAVDPLEGDDDFDVPSFLK
jgi:hypothetical protein